MPPINTQTFGCSILCFIDGLKAKSFISFIGSRRFWLSVCTHIYVLMHLLCMRVFCSACLYCFIGHLALCVFSIDGGSHHTSSCLSSHTLKHTCMFVSSNDPLAEPESSIPLCLFLRSWNKFWPQFGFDFAPQHTSPAVIHISSQCT